MTATAWNQKTIDAFHAQNGLGIPPWGDHVLLMTAKGAKSGEPHTTPLVYRRVEDDYVVIASKGGAPADPTWFNNIRANPEVEVEVASNGGTEKLKARARVIASGPEHDRLYNHLAEVWPAFLDYQKKTTRVIPVVVLEPSRD
jgi:deazaflavin-dependent oxidoreductase (nitroreductase family)